MQRIVLLLLTLPVFPLAANENIDCLQPQCIRAVEPSAAATPVDASATSSLEDESSSNEKTPETSIFENDESASTTTAADENDVAAENDTAAASENEVADSASENDDVAPTPETATVPAQTPETPSAADDLATETDAVTSSENEDADPAPVPETPQPEQTTLPEMPTTATEENTPAVPATSETPSTTAKKYWIVIAAASGFLLMLLTLWLLLHRKAKNRQPQAFAELVEYQPQGEVRHSLHQIVTQLGRSPRCEIVFSDGSISAIHAAVKRETNGLVNLIDLKSSNGTKVNNQSVSQTALNSGDMIELGETKLRYQQLR